MPIMVTSTVGALDSPSAYQPRVPISNVTLRDVFSTGGLLSPGIIRCNATKPCHNFVFDNVHVQGERPSGLKKE